MNFVYFICSIKKSLLSTTSMVMIHYLASFELRNDRFYYTRAVKHHKSTITQFIITLVAVKSLIK